MYKLAINSSALATTLAVVCRVINSKNSLPILEKVLLHKVGDNFVLTGSSSENELSKTLPELIVTEGEFFPVCLDGDDIQNVLGTLPDQPIEITIDDKGNAEFKYEKGKFSICYEQADAFPLRHPLEDKDCKVAFTVQTGDFLRSIRSALVSVDKVTTIRPAMTAVVLDVQQDGFFVVSSDGCTLYKETFTPGAPFLETGSPMMLLIPNATVSTICTAFKEYENIHIEATLNDVRLSQDGTEFVIRTIEGKFPNYNAVIPTEQEYHFTVDRKALVDTVKRVAVFSSMASRLITLGKAEDGELAIATQDLDFNNSSSESVAIDDSNLPDGYRIGVNYQSLLDMVGVMGSEKIVFKLGSPDRAMVLKDTDKSILGLVMPLTLAD